MLWKGEQQVMIKKILVVDDDEPISSYLLRKFTKLGYTAYAAEDGEKAVQLAFSNFPDIILLDVKLPKLGGIEVCKRLKADDRTKNIPILMLSAKAQSFEIKEGLAAGADKYLCKPMSFPAILNEIRAYDKK
jgi:DNA-binding response OmpR family regulator